MLPIKIFEGFRKVDRMIEPQWMECNVPPNGWKYQAQNLEKGGSRNLKWIILAVILAIVVIYAVWGQ